MTTTIERPESRKAGHAWRKPFPIGRGKFIFNKEDAKSDNKNFELIQKISEFDPSDSPLPIFTDELTTDFKLLNEARTGYQSLLSSKHPDYWVNYSRKSKEKIEDLIKNYEWVKGSFSGNSFPPRALEPHERMDEQRDPLDSIAEKCENARKPAGKLIEHANQWTTWILAKQKVKFTQEVKELVTRNATDTIRIIMPGYEELFLVKLKERLVFKLQKYACSEIAYVDIKPGTIQEKIYPYLILGWSNYKISKKLYLKSNQVEKAKLYLKKRGVLPNISDTEKATLRKSWREEMANDPDYIGVKNRVKKRQKNAEKRGFYASFETRGKMSESKGGVLPFIDELAKRKLTPRVMMQLTKKSQSAVLNCIYRIRLQEEKYGKKLTNKDTSLTKSEANRERYIDLSISDTFEANRLNRESFCKESLPSAQRGVMDLLQKLYPIDLLSQKQKEDLVERIARSVLESYEPIENLGFHAQAVIWISQNLPESPIYGKINQSAL